MLSASKPAFLIASAFLFHSSISWLMAAASSTLASLSLSCNIRILVLISFRVEACAFHFGVLSSTALPAFFIALAFSVHIAICWLIVAASSTLASLSLSCNICILALISFRVVASSFHSGVLSLTAFPASSIASALACHRAICWLISAASSTVAF